MDQQTPEVPPMQRARNMRAWLIPAATAVLGLAAGAGITLATQDPTESAEYEQISALLDTAEAARDKAQSEGDLARSRLADTERALTLSSEKAAEARGRVVELQDELAASSASEPSAPAPQAEAAPGSSAVRDAQVLALQVALLSGSTDELCEGYRELGPEITAGAVNASVDGDGFPVDVVQEVFDATC